MASRRKLKSDILNKLSYVGLEDISDEEVLDLHREASALLEEGARYEQKDELNTKYSKNLYEASLDRLESVEVVKNIEKGSLF